ncbi:hypothetical protein BJ166DRAFT_78745 [Pestalotiopsis sp. NC0098]|nr:hypothetical protein BJ166DRAFT_78745 [Pestalotiopsis sp. NC0098]
MKFTPFLASLGLLHTQAVLAQSTTTTTAATSTTATSTAASCTASLITKLCDYPEPGPDFAVAAGGVADCWEYCNDHSPCSFVIFRAGNPYTGTGTCWLYPGETYNATAGSSDCSNPYLSVYDAPVCSGGSATTTSGACAATATPSAIASVCDYPTPGDCFDGCTASTSAGNCLSQCAAADACSYVVFNPHNPDNSPYASGTCWIYPNGTYDASLATACSNPEQYVYVNSCPKPSSSVPTTLATVTGTSAAALSDTTSSSQSSAPTALSRRSPLAIGMGLLLWHGLDQ